jgi:dTDP-L-rhamnose 4-epimerase
VPLHGDPSPSEGTRRVKALVTGAAGFIGSHVVDRLVDDGWEVTGIDVLHPAAHAGWPPYLNRQMDFIELDVTDGDRLGHVVGRFDAVCHQAAMVGLGESFVDAPDYVRANDLGTAVLLRELARRGFNGPLVLASSMAVYGEGAYRCDEHGSIAATSRRREDLARGRFDPRCPSCGRDLEPEAISEDFPPSPRNVYAATKLHQEHLCYSFGLETGSRVVALRYHNVYGPRMPADTPYSGVAAVFRTSIEKGEAPRVLEDGRQLRDFIHVSDVAEANVQSLANPAAEGPLNVATGSPHSVGEMAWLLWEAAGRGSAPEINRGARVGDVRHVFGSPERLRSTLGLSASVNFARGMELFARDPLRPKGARLSYFS